MNSQDLLPFLSKFITVTLDDGSQRSGYVSNPQQIKHPSSDDPELCLVNGFFTEHVSVSRIINIEVPNRVETVSLPVVDMKKGYSAGNESEE